MSRRRVLMAGAGAGLGGMGLGWLGGGAQAHPTMGPVRPPLPLPDVTITDQAGRQQRLRPWLSGAVTAVQTMYTGCGSVCPIQGALFAEVQAQWATEASASAPSSSRPVRWLSLSIDPMGDTPAQLKAWLQRWQAGPQWRAARPDPQDVDALLGCLHGTEVAGAKAPGRVASAVADASHHPARVFMLDTQAQLVWRTPPLPSPEELIRVLSVLVSGVPSV